MVNEPRLSHKLALLEALLAYREGNLPDPYPQLLTLCNQLAAFDPVLEPSARAEVLTGNWLLLYSNRVTFSALDQVPGSRLGRIYQALDAATQGVFNLAEITILGLKSVVAVQARFSPAYGKRVKVQFEEGLVTTVNFLTGENPTNWIEQLQSGEATALRFPTPSSQRGWLEIIYVDDTLRLSLGNEGSLFILTRVTPAPLKKGTRE